MEAFKIGRDFFLVAKGMGHNRIGEQLMGSSVHEVNIHNLEESLV